MQALDLDVATEFLLIAATLVELKARRLLPGRADVDLDEELALWSERDLLLARLLECKTFKDVAPCSAASPTPPTAASPARSAPTSASPAWCPTCSPGSRRSACATPPSRASRRKPVPRIDLFHVAPIRASVADAVAELVDELPRLGRVTFRRLTDAPGRAAGGRSSASSPCSSCSSRASSTSTRRERFGDIEIALASRRGRRRSTSRHSPSTCTRAEMDELDLIPTADDADGPAATPTTSGGRSRPSSSSPTSRCRPSCSPNCSSGRSPTSSAGAASSPSEYAADGRGFELVRVAGGYRYQTHPDLTPYVERFLLHDQRARLSGAALETLAIVAYKQPISRAQIASIRGVDPDGVLRTLQGRGLHRPGRARPGSRPGAAVRHDAGVPREARPRLARRPAADRRVRPGRRRRRGARDRPAGLRWPSPD